MNHVWTESEKNFIRQNAARLKDFELAAALSRVTGRHVSLHAVRHARARMGIKKNPGHGVCRVRRPSPPKASVGLSIRAEQ